MKYLLKTCSWMYNWSVVLQTSGLFFLYTVNKILKSGLFLLKCVVTTTDVCRWGMSLEQLQQDRTTTVPVWITLSPIWTLILFQNLSKIVFEPGMSTHGTPRECWVRLSNSSYTATPSARGCTDTDIGCNSHFCFSELHMRRAGYSIYFRKQKNCRAVPCLLLYKFYRFI